MISIIAAILKQITLAATAEMEKHVWGAGRQGSRFGFYELGVSFGEFRLWVLVSVVHIPAPVHYRETGTWRAEACLAIAFSHVFSSKAASNYCSQTSTWGGLDRSVTNIVAPYSQCSHIIG